MPNISSARHQTDDDDTAVVVRGDDGSSTSGGKEQQPDNDDQTSTATIDPQAAQQAAFDAFSSSASSYGLGSDAWSAALNDASTAAAAGAGAGSGDSSFHTGSVPFAVDDHFSHMLQQNERGHDDHLSGPIDFPSYSRFNSSAAAGPSSSLRSTHHLSFPQLPWDDPAADAWTQPQQPHASSSSGGAAASSGANGTSGSNKRKATDSSRGPILQADGTYRPPPLSGLRPRAPRTSLREQDGPDRSPESSLSPSASVRSLQRDSASPPPAPPPPPSLPHPHDSYDPELLNQPGGEVQQNPQQHQQHHQLHHLHNLPHHLNGGHSPGGSSPASSPWPLPLGVDDGSQQGQQQQGEQPQNGVGSSSAPSTTGTTPAGGPPVKRARLSNPVKVYLPEELPQSFKVRKRSSPENKPFHCEECDRSFTRKNDLVRHRGIHADQRPYICEVCQKAFRQPWHLKNHAVVHTGEQPFACELCATRFTESGALSRHRRTHLVDRPFQCGKCERAFKRKDGLKKHAESVHGGDAGALNPPAQTQPSTSGTQADASSHPSGSRTTPMMGGQQHQLQLQHEEQYTNGGGHPTGHLDEDEEAARQRSLEEDAAALAAALEGVHAEVARANASAAAAAAEAEAEAAAAAGLGGGVGEGVSGQGEGLGDGLGEEGEGLEHHQHEQQQQQHELEQNHHDIHEGVLEEEHGGREAGGDIQGENEEQDVGGHDENVLNADDLGDVPDEMLVAVKQELA